MSKVALFIKAKAQPGKRDEVRRVWEEHLKPHSETSETMEVCVYCYSTQDEDTICLFELLSDESELEAASKSDWFAAYMQAVTPLLAGPPEMVITRPIWAKGASI